MFVFYDADRDEQALESLISPSPATHARSPALGAGQGFRGLEKADELEDALRASFAHDGPALVDVRTTRQELSLLPKTILEQVKGFSLLR